MRKTIIFAALAAVMCACSNDEQSLESDELVDVSIGFSGFTYQQVAMTRTDGQVSDICTHLDIWLNDGTTTTAYHQATGDDGFGSLSVTLSLAKTYTIYAVAHKANGAATLADGIISFPDDKVTHSFFISHDFTPTKNMSLNLTMNRIVSMFQFVTTDEVPDWCKTMRFTLYNVYDQWNVSTGGTHQLNRVSTFQNFTKQNDGTVIFNIYAIVANTSTNHDILIEGLNEDGDVLEYHTLKDVPLRNGYKTVATGAFFTDAASSFFFKAEDWPANIDYDF